MKYLNNGDLILGKNNKFEKVLFTTKAKSNHLIKITYNDLN